jgi:cystathionine beta-synthase
MAVAMIETAERSGVLKAGGTIIEATAGNTGIGLALVAAVKGYRLTLVIPDKMSPEKIAHAKALGADIQLTVSDVAPGHPDYYVDMATRIARETGAFHINQFENPANPLAHETTTGPEIWQQMEHRVDAVVCGAGSGIGQSCIPAIADLSRVRRAYSISDAESFATARELLARTGILAGSSSGTLIAAALRYCREQARPKRVITFICDSGAKYLSKMYNDAWLRCQLQ